MGSDIGDLFERRESELGTHLRGQIIAIDAYNTIYQFLSSIRQRDGTPLKDSRGRVTSHLSGLLYRTTNLVESGLKLVFDGAPPDFKAATIEKRREIRDTAEREWKEALAAGREDALKYAQATSRLQPEMVEGVKSLLLSMGIPVVEAAGDGIRTAQVPRHLGGQFRTRLYTFFVKSYVRITNPKSLCEARQFGIRLFLWRMGFRNLCKNRRGATQ